jgi:predicted RecB family nuclease
MTAATLRLLQMCERRVWLDRNGHASLRDEITPILAYRLEKGIEHERAIHEAVGVPTEPIVIATWADGVRITGDLMAQGISIIIGAYLERTVRLQGTDDPLLLRSRVDRLERMDTRHRLGWGGHHDSPVYAPIEIKQYTRLSEADLLQLDAYLWMLEALQPQSTVGWFWLGQDEECQPLRKIEHHLDVERLESTLVRLINVLQQRDIPPVRLETHCKTCHWYSGCRSEASARLHVSILPGVSRQAKQHLQASGITTLDQIVAMPPEMLTQFKGIKSTARAVHAQARAFVENRPVWVQE